MYFYRCVKYIYRSTALRQVHVHLQKYRVLVLMTSTSTCTCLSTNMSTFIDEGKYMSEQEQVYNYFMCQMIPFAKSVAC